MGLWSLEMRDKLIAHQGSIQEIDEIPAEIKSLYKTVPSLPRQSLKTKTTKKKKKLHLLTKLPPPSQTQTWEISQMVRIDMARDRGCFICGSQSLNINMANPSDDTMSSMHFYGWRAGLKTGGLSVFCLPFPFPLSSPTVAPSPRATPPPLQHIKSLLFTFPFFFSFFKKGMYYLRRRPVSDPIPMTNLTRAVQEVEDKEDRKVTPERVEAAPVCTKQKGCISCGS
jgi:ribonucleotide reductase alpha subunit